MKKMSKKSTLKLNSTSVVFSIVMLFLLSILLFIPSVAALPHPIYGSATWDGGEYAVGANVEIVSSQGVLQTTVDEHGGWQVDVGDPGPSWQSGISFTVFINGTGQYIGWYGTAFGIADGYFNDMENIVVSSSDQPFNNFQDDNTSNDLNDTVDVGDIGYLTDSDGDGSYDTFYDGAGLRTDIEQYEEDKYLIDNNGDGKWDYTFDQTEGVKTFENEEKQNETPGFELIIIVISIALIVFFSRRW